MSTMANDPRLIQEQSTGLLGELLRRLRQADLGALPVILGLVIIWVVFQIANPLFLTPRNLTNLMLQIAAMGTIAIGVVLVLLLGEVDLSLGAVSGLAAAVMAVLNVKAGVPAPLAVLAGLVTGCAIGLLQGWWIARLRVPSFIVTLAGQIGWTGALLYILGIAGTFLPDAVGWAIGILFVVLFSASIVRRRQRRQAAGLTVPGMQALVARIVLIAIGVLGSIWIVNADRGLPSAAIIFLGLIILFDYITRRTTWGRHVYAVGGSGELLLDTIAAAVIGGTSLFGGRGSVWAALLGALVIGSISNGMDLLALASPIKYMIT